MGEQLPIFTRACDEKIQELQKEIEFYKTNYSLTLKLVGKLKTRVSDLEMGISMMLENVLPCPTENLNPEYQADILLNIKHDMEDLLDGVQK